MIVQITTTDVAHGGYCVGRHESIVVFATGALPGEVVDVEITNQRAKLWYGHVVAVISASDDRIDHVWPQGDSAGVQAADLGHVSLKAGRDWKARVIATQMRQLARIPVQVRVEPAPGDEARLGLAWRTRLVLQVLRSGQLGMFRAKTHQVVSIDTMPLAHEDIQAAINNHVLVKPDHPGSTLSFVRASKSGLIVIPSSLKTGANSGSLTEEVSTKYGTWAYQVAPTGFWQVHRQAPQVLVEAVLEAVGDTAGPVFDLYAGCGLFSVPLAEFYQGLVHAIEVSPLAGEYLRGNTADYGVKSLIGDVVDVLDTQQPTGGGVIVCDPPRSGAGRIAIAQMVRLGPDRIVYVACDPATLARDVGLLVQYGYELSSLRGFDLFPMTHHVECLAVLTRPSNSSAKLPSRLIAGNN